MTKKIIGIVFLIISVLIIGFLFWYSSFLKDRNTLIYKSNNNKYRVAIAKTSFTDFDFSNFKLKTNVIDNIYDSKINLILHGQIPPTKEKIEIQEPISSPKLLSSYTESVYSIKLQELDCQIQDDQLIILARGIPNPDKPELEFNIACELRNLKPNKYSIKYGENGSVIDTFEIKQINPK
jgi:hypothetical protein